MTSAFIGLLLFFIFIGMIPIITLLLQFFLAGFHGISNHYAKCEPYQPRVAILIPSWNEAVVLSNTLDRLMSMDYPHACLRVYVIDDGSTDHTEQIVCAKANHYPDNIFYLRHAIGGLGKSVALNVGLKTVLADDWAEAIMIMDADTIFEPNALLRMTRHLADPKVGAVTSYIKVGQSADNFLTHSIAAEYILAQAIARRAQNVMGVLACLAGGAQMHRRENIERLGGQINTETLAEDTYTTFLTQINHHRAIFEGNAIVRAEEPETLPAFWKQRFRWSRGNVQITLAFRHLWFRRSHHSNLGGIFFGMTWFSTLLMPFAMLLTSFSLIILFFIDPMRSWLVFRWFYVISAVSYVFSTLLSVAIDPLTMRRAWFSALLFPGAISLCMMVLSIAPSYVDSFQVTSSSFYFMSWREGLLLCMDAWVALCMFCAFGVYRLSRLQVSPLLINFLIAIVGYGPLLCSVTFFSFMAEMRKSNIIWDKTEKKAPTQEKSIAPYQALSFEALLKKDQRAEIRLLRDEILIIVLMASFFYGIPLFIYYSSLRFQL
jgi:cellulose synthase/poly-beta-1,6-N-acetylglucosamine synthase-like glycosyltransferase